MLSTKHRTQKTKLHAPHKTALKAPVDANDIFKDDVDIQHYKKLVQMHNGVEVQTEADLEKIEKCSLNIILNFNPQEMHAEKAQELLKLGTLFNKYQTEIKQIITCLNAKPERTQYDVEKTKRLFEYQIIFYSLASFVIPKYKAYKAYLVAETERFNKEMAAFKLIYHALYQGETSCFKGHNFMVGREKYTPTELMNDIKLNNSDRTQKALELAKKFADTCTWNNEALFTEIYQYSFKRSGFFSVSHLLGSSIFRSKTISGYHHLQPKKEHIDSHPWSRTAKISHALGYQKVEEIENPLKNISLRK